MRTRAAPRELDEKRSALVVSRAVAPAPSPRSQPASLGPSPGVGFELGSIAIAPPTATSSDLSSLVQTWLLAAMRNEGTASPDAADPGELSAVAIYLVEELQQGRAPANPSDATPAVAIGIVARRIQHNAALVARLLTTGVRMIDGRLIRPAPAHVVAAHLGFGPLDPLYSSTP